MTTDIKNKNYKLYLAKFTRRTTGEIFHKVGYTHNYDAKKRFEYDEYDPWFVDIQASAWGPKDLVLQAEAELLTRFPKNLYIHEKINGVKEIFTTDRAGLDFLFAYFKNKSNLWYNMRTTNHNG